MFRTVSPSHSRMDQSGKARVVWRGERVPDLLREPEGPLIYSVHHPASSQRNSRLGPEPPEWRALHTSVAVSLVSSAWCRVSKITHAIGGVLGPPPWYGHPLGTVTDSHSTFQLHTLTSPHHLSPAATLGFSLMPLLSCMGVFC